MCYFCYGWETEVSLYSISGLHGNQTQELKDTEEWIKKDTENN